MVKYSYSGKNSHRVDMPEEGEEEVLFRVYYVISIECRFFQRFPGGNGGHRLSFAIRYV